VSRPVLPGAAIGVLGSGQLGRMFAIAARRMGYRVHTFSPDYDTPTGQVADVEVSASYDDLDAVRTFAEKVDVVSFEFENVPAATAAAAAERCLVRPSGEVLHITQNRLREKRFLASNGFPVTPFEEVLSLEQLRTLTAEEKNDSILKTAGWGYDGKGQARLQPGADPAPAWQNLATEEAILEQFVPFDFEVSVVVGRGVSGEIRTFEVTRNDHVRHILDVSSAPALLPAATRSAALEISAAVAETLDLVGVLCIEFFVTTDGSLLINELAPRPHNSGHWTFDAAVTSQFEQQLRAICGLPLGSTEQLRPVAMANLLGDLWSEAEPRWELACRYPDIKLHLYGKMAPRDGRKMGHLTAMAGSAPEALALVRQARASLKS
jgi:5-(carboxyamino)imidazole ribonucleotide synthase